MLKVRTLAEVKAASGGASCPNAIDPMITEKNTANIFPPVKQLPKEKKRNDKLTLLFNWVDNHYDH